MWLWRVYVCNAMRSCNLPSWNLQNGPPSNKFPNSKYKGHSSPTVNCSNYCAASAAAVAPAVATKTQLRERMQSEPLLQPLLRSSSGPSFVSHWTLAVASVRGNLTRTWLPLNSLVISPCRVCDGAATQELSMCQH